VTDVSIEPAMMEDGVIAVIAGAGFEVGVGLAGAVVPPPQPVIIPMQDKTVAESTHVARFIRDSYLRNKLNLTPQVRTENIIPFYIWYTGILLPPQPVKGSRSQPLDDPWPVERSYGLH
jgi:hypothetical protein